jgi:hypothetical protein
MEKESFRERNRRRREENAFENLYGYARETKIPDPKRTAERTARRLHRDGEVRTRPAGGASTDAQSTGAELAEQTKEELYERAKELDIEGRSSMNKDELIEALQTRI